VGFWGLPIRLDVRPTDPQNTDTSTVDTIHQMIALAKASANTPVVNSVVNSCIQSLPKTYSNRDLARAIWWWVKRKVTFVTDEEILARHLGYEKDPFQELLIPPVTLLSMPTPMGDCDDFSLLVASLLTCAHIPCWYVAIAVDEDEPSRFSHVFVVCYLSDEDQRMTMDCSHGTVPGWETKRYVYRRMEWQVS
jgi:transglutaminase-like putative cysteine protease